MQLTKKQGGGGGYRGCHAFWSAAACRSYSFIQGVIQRAGTLHSPRLSTEKRWLQNEVEHLIGEKSEVQRARHRERQNKTNRNRKSHRSCRRCFRAGLAHVHHYDDSQVVVRPDDAV